MFFSKTKIQKSYKKLIQNVQILRIETEDESEDFIEIIFPLNEDFIKELKTLLDKGAKPDQEDLDFVRDNFDCFVKMLEEAPFHYQDEDYSFDDSLDENGLREWIKNHPRILAFQKIYELLCEKTSLNKN